MKNHPAACPPAWHIGFWILLFRCRTFRRETESYLSARLVCTISAVQVPQPKFLPNTASPSGVRAEMVLQPKVPPLKSMDNRPWNTSCITNSATARSSEAPPCSKKLSNL